MERNLRVCRLYKSVFRLVLGLVVGAFLVLVCDTAIPAFLAEKDPLHTLSWRVFLSLASYHFYYSEFLTPIGEEIGWRGYALPRLQACVGPVWASVLIGLAWAGFMLPALGLVQMYGAAVILMYAIGLVSLSVEMTFAANLSGFSIIVAIVMHALASTQSGYLSRGFIAHAQPRAHWEWAWSVATLLVPALLLLATRGRLGADRQSDSSASLL